MINCDISVTSKDLDKLEDVLETALNKIKAGVLKHSVDAVDYNINMLIAINNDEYKTTTGQVIRSTDMNDIMEKNFYNSL